MTSLAILYITITINFEKKILLLFVFDLYKFYIFQKNFRKKNNIESFDEILAIVVSLPTHHSLRAMDKGEVLGRMSRCILSRKWWGGIGWEKKKTAFSAQALLRSLSKDLS